MSKHSWLWLALLAMLLGGGVTGCGPTPDENTTPEVYNPATNDSDGDGTPDAIDAFPNNATESRDFDHDGIGDSADTDDDNDGVPDTTDAFPYNPLEYVDTDGDGIGDNLDADDDGDGTADVNDAFPLDAAEQLDTDGDGIGNNADLDDDNDIVPDTDDAFPLDPGEQRDFDGDHIGDNADLDDDNDRVPDWQDAYPTDASRWAPDSTTLSGDVYGSVSDPFNTPLADIPVTLGSGRTTRTDTTGSFRFENVAAGTYAVATAPRGYVRSEVSVTIAAEETQYVWLVPVIGFKLSDQPSAEIVAVVNAGADLLVFDDGWLGSYRDQTEAPPGTLFLVNLQGGASRTIAHHVYLGRYPGPNGWPLFSPSRKLLYVKQELANVERIQVYNLATASVGGLLPEQCDWPRLWNSDESLAYTAGVSPAPACVVRATGGADVHVLPASPPLDSYGFVSDGSFLYGHTLANQGGVDLLRVVASDLPTAALLSHVRNTPLVPGCWNNLQSLPYREISGNRITVAECKDLPCATTRLKRFDLAGSNSLMDESSADQCLAAETVNGYVIRVGDGGAAPFVYRYALFETTSPRALIGMNGSTLVHLVGTESVLHRGPIGEIKRTKLTDAMTGDLLSSGYDTRWTFDNNFCFTPGNDQFVFMPTDAMTVGAWVATSESTGATHIDRHLDTSISQWACTTGVLLTYESINNDTEKVVTAFSIPAGQIIKSYTELTDHTGFGLLGVYGSNDTAFIALDRPDSFTVERCTVATTGGCVLVDRGVLHPPWWTGTALEYTISNVAQAVFNDLAIGEQWIMYDIVTQQRTVVPYAMVEPVFWNNSYYGISRTSGNQIVRWTPPEQQVTLVADRRLCNGGSSLAGWYWFPVMNYFLGGNAGQTACSYDSVILQTRGSFGTTYVGMIN